MVAFLDRIVGVIRKQKDKKDLKENFYTKDFFCDKPYVIGEHTYGKPNVLHWGEAANLYIGKYCSIADDVTIFLGGNHRIDWISTYPFNILSEYFPNAKKIVGHPATKGDVKIGNDVWIGYGATILSGVTIGNGAVIGTKAIVAKDVPSYAVVVGNPAEIKKYRFSKDDIEKLEQIAWWNWDDSKVNEKIKMICNNDIQCFFKENAI